MARELKSKHEYLLQEREKYRAEHGKDPPWWFNKREVLVSFPLWLLVELDQYCERAGVSRSLAIRGAVIEVLDDCSE